MTFSGICVKINGKVDNLYALSALFHVPLDALVCGNRSDVFSLDQILYYDRMIAYYERIKNMNAA